MTDPIDSETKRILQIYDAEKQRQFQHFSTQDRLEWLEEINELYWQTRQSRLSPDRERQG